jgi:hypothetical protein
VEAGPYDLEMNAQSPAWFREDEKHDMRVDECQMSFFIHLWVEDGERPSWRGRVNDGESGHSIAFEDEQALLGFIRSRLLSASIVLPQRRAES